jgi:serine/threonine protein kinase
MARLRHPHILRVLHVAARPQAPYYVMPHVKEGSLAQRLQPGRPLADAATLAIARQVAGALCYAHGRGLIHRDLKPGNVLVDARGRAFLADFGLVRTVFNDPLVDVQKVHYVGTAAYVSPAVALGLAEDTRCDIYGFGALLYEMLTGEAPYRGTSAEDILAQVRRGPPCPIRERNPRAGQALVQIAEGAMARELRDRYAQMADVVADLQRVTRGQAPVGPHGRPRHKRRRIGRRTAAFLASMGIAAGVALGATLGFRLWSSAPSPPLQGAPPQAPAAPKRNTRVQIQGFSAASNGGALQSSFHSSCLQIKDRHVEVTDLHHPPDTRLTWDWGDGSPAESHGLPARHHYAKAGAYHIRVTLTDADGVNTTEDLPVVVE